MRLSLELLQLRKELRKEHIQNLKLKEFALSIHKVRLSLNP